MRYRALGEQVGPRARDLNTQQASKTRLHQQRSESPPRHLTD